MCVCICIYIYVYIFDALGVFPPHIFESESASLVVLKELFFGGGVLCETVSLCIPARTLPSLELANQAGLKLTQTHLPLPPNVGIKGVCHHANSGFF